MLRQFHIFHKGKPIISHTYALALGPKELKNVIEIIRSYIIMPMPGKTLRRPISNYQIFHRGYGSIYFLLIADLNDPFDRVDEILKKAISKFMDFFPDPDEVDDFLNTGFLEFLKQIQKDLHSKITIMGPSKSGRTTLYNMLKSGQEKLIQDFAKYSPFVIDDLTFEIWDFQLKDDFSAMWSRFVGESDLIIFLIDSNNYNSKLIEHFLNIPKKYEKFAKIAVIANKKDLVPKEIIDIIKSDFNFTDLEEITLLDSGAKTKIYQIIRDSLNLRKLLPVNFENLVKEAEKLDSEGKIQKAIAKYGKLIDISNQYQYFAYIDDFKEKLEVLIRKRKKIQRKEKFSAPEQIQFSKKISVKSLPKNNKVSAKPLPKNTASPTIPPKIAPQIPPRIPPEIPPRPSQSSKQAKKSPIQTTPSTKLTLKPEDIKINLKTKIDKIKKVKQKSEPTSVESPTEVKGVMDEIIVEEGSELAMTLQKLIIEKGSNLPIALCEKYIDELEKTLEVSLTLNDLQLAVQYFVKIEKEL